MCKTIALNGLAPILAHFDENQNILVVGNSQSTNKNYHIATVNTHQSIPAGRTDALIVKFDGDGQRI